MSFDRRTGFDPPSFDPRPAARELLRLRQERRLLERLAPHTAPSNEAEGAAVQYEMARMAGAVPPGGFKIGATGQRMQAYLGLAAPIGGYMRAQDVHHGHAELRFADTMRPGVECEVAVRLDHDLPPGPCSREQAMAAIGAFCAGIELVDNRYGDLQLLGTPALVADQMYHAAAVVGEQGNIDWRGLDIGALRGRITVRDGPSDDGITTDLLGHPLNALAWLAGSPLAAAFGGLKAGQVIMLGSVTPPLWLSSPGHITVEFAPLPPVTLQLV